MAIAGVAAHIMAILIFTLFIAKYTFHKKTLNLRYLAAHVKTDLGNSQCRLSIDSICCPFRKIMVLYISTSIQTCILFPGSVNVICQIDLIFIIKEVSITLNTFSIIIMVTENYLFMAEDTLHENALRFNSLLIISSTLSGNTQVRPGMLNILLDHPIRNVSLESNDNIIL